MVKRLISSCALMLVLCPSISTAETVHRNVLLLNSYHSGYKWTDAVTTAVNQVIGNRSDIHLFVEYMDTKRWSDDSHFQMDMDQTIRLVTEPDITLSLDAEPDAANVWLDRNQLGQAVLNLVTNARDAMPDGGHLSIRIRNAVRRETFEELHPGVRGRGHVILEVTDTGEGMPADVRARVFEPFFSTKEVGKGTGLGLSMVYGFVQQSGGDIKVASNPGEGASFTILLPIVPPEASTGETLADDPGRESHATTILVVDDEDPVREFIVESLQHLGFNVLDTSDPREAINLVTQHGGIELLITDVEMPSMSGPDLANLLCAKVPGLPVLFISGYTSLMEGGATLDEERFLTKPFSLGVLAAKVRDVIGTPSDPTPPHRG